MFYPARGSDQTMVQMDSRARAKMAGQPEYLSGCGSNPQRSRGNSISLPDGVYQ